jgi:hypothetical protein
MELNDIVSFQFKRVNPFEGLVVDADTWRDAHTYHRDQQRLHVLAYHQIGIVSGLEVTASDPSDISSKHAKKRRSTSLSSSARYPQGHINPRMVVSRPASWRLTEFKKETSCPMSPILSWLV